MDMDFLPDERPMEPVAVVRTDFPLKFGLPRQSGLVPFAQGNGRVRAQVSRSERAARH